MAHTEVNKFDAGGRFGDPDWNKGTLGEDMAPDFAADSAGLPAAGVNNKFDITTSFGDSDFTAVDNDNAEDVAEDGAGVPSVDSGLQKTKTDMDMALEPNRFPRETGHDSLTEEGAQIKP